MQKTFKNPRRLDPIYQQEYEEEKEAHRKITKSEWLQIFPEAQSYLDQSLINNLEKKAKQEKRYEKQLERINDIEDDDAREFLLQVADHFAGQDIKDTEEEIKRINQYLKALADIDVPGRITQQDIENAKLADWENLITPQKRARKHEFMAICPFHQEKTASFLVKNGFGYCFGCQWQGDTIKFIMELEQITFIQAVKKLK